MIHDMVSGGGIALNFKMVGNPKPTNPKENTIWIDTDMDITSWDFSIEPPCLRSNNRNMITHPFVSGTTQVYGIKYTDNGDGTISVEVMGTQAGTSKYSLSSNSAVDIDRNLYLLAGTYFLSGCPSGGIDGRCRIVCYDSLTNEVIAEDTGNGAIFTLSISRHVYCKIVFDARNDNVHIEGILLKPQIERGSVATEFIKGDATGQIWVQTDTTSGVPFNALKRNGIMIYPSAVKQYGPSGTVHKWVGKTAELYNGNEWIDIN